MPEYVCLQPCLGINHTLTTVVRQACYVVAEDLLPGKIHLGCSPALNAGVLEDVDFIMNDYVVTIEACDKACATKLVKREGGNVHAALMAEDVAKEEGISAEGESPEFFDTEHPWVQKFAQRIASVCEGLLASERAGEKDQPE